MYKIFKSATTTLPLSTTAQHLYNQNQTKKLRKGISNIYTPKNYKKNHIRKNKGNGCVFCPFERKIYSFKSFKKFKIFRNKVYTRLINKIAKKKEGTYTYYYYLFVHFSIIMNLILFV